MNTAVKIQNIPLLKSRQPVTQVRAWKRTETWHRASGFLYLGDLDTPVEEELRTNAILVLADVVEEAAVRHQLSDQLHCWGETNPQETTHIRAGNPRHHIRLLEAERGHMWTSILCAAAHHLSLYLPCTHIENFFVGFWWRVFSQHLNGHRDFHILPIRSPNSLKRWSKSSHTKLATLSATANNAVKHMCYDRTL